MAHGSRLKNDFGAGRYYSKRKAVPGVCSSSAAKRQVLQSVPARILPHLHPHCECSRQAACIASIPVLVPFERCCSKAWACLQASCKRLQPLPCTNMAWLPAAIARLLACLRAGQCPVACASKKPCYVKQAASVPSYMLWNRINKLEDALQV